MKENFYQQFPFLNRKNYKHNSILYILINAFMKFIEHVTFFNLERLQNWLHSLANLLPVIHEAYHDEAWTPTESQQALIRSWEEVNKTIEIRTLRGINFTSRFSCGIEFPRSRSSTYVYFDADEGRMNGHSNYPVS